MKTTVYRADTRGHNDHGWLNTFHTFSFDRYYDPNRVHFGALRVLNDDTVQGGKGFGTHPHDNMEIITIPLKGALEHRDSMGSHGVIHAGDVQVMSAGTGITHSEFNASQDEEVRFFQIWVFPNKTNVTPRYQQETLDFLGNKNRLFQIVSPDPADEGLWIYQNAWFHIGEFDRNTSFDYKLKNGENGVFAMVIEGEFDIAGELLSRRDGLGITDTQTIRVKALTDSARLLLIEVPLAI